MIVTYLNPKVSGIYVRKLWSLILGYTTNVYSLSSRERASDLDMKARGNNNPKWGLLYNQNITCRCPMRTLPSFGARLPGAQLKMWVTRFTKPEPSYGILTHVFCDRKQDILAVLRRSVRRFFFDVGCIFILGCSLLILCRRATSQQSSWPLLS